jgi:RimJ/RimL family protein N-acetyltransferase
MTAQSVRRLTARDAREFRDLRLESLRLHPEAYGSRLSDWDEQPPSAFADRLSRSHVFGLLEAGSLVGIAALDRERGGNTNHRGLVTAVYVRAAHRGRGGLARLMDAVESAGRGMGLVQIELTVADDNAAARNGYLRAGYRPVATLPRALRDAAGFRDEILMILTLDG